MSERFKYLGSKEWLKDVVHSMKSGCLNWRADTRVLCDLNIPLEQMEKLYMTSIRPVLIYGTKYWASKKEHIKKVKVMELCMLRWMCANTLRN